MKDTRYTIKKGFTKTPKVRPNLSFTYVNEKNFEANMRAFADSVDLENKTRQVHSFTLLEAQERIKDGCVAYLFKEGDKPLGHVWFYQNYMYDVFLGKTGRRNDDEALLRAVIEDYNHPAASSVHVYTEGYNKFENTLYGKKLDGVVGNIN
jgi:hypothetical protein